MSKMRQTRMVGIDLARTIAILLAMASHVLSVSETSKFYRGCVLDVVRPVLHAATPTFIILFGTMLSIVYLPRFQGDQQRDQASRLLTRALQCWMLYCLSVIVLFLFQPGYSLLFSLSTMMMMGVTPFTDILKFYTVVLAASPAMLWLVRRHGLAPLVIVALSVHLLHPILTRAPGPSAFGLPKEADRVTMFLSGVGDTPLAGPSALHGLTLVVFGMVLGRLLQAAHQRAVYLYTLTGGAITLLAGAGALFRRSILAAGSMPLRMDNDPIYFAAGLCNACILTGLAMLITRLGGSQETWDRYTFFGRTSLFTFAVGNMLLYCVTFSPRTAVQSLVLTLCLMSVIIALSFAFDRAVRHHGRAARVLEMIRSVLYKAVYAALQSRESRSALQTTEK